MALITALITCSAVKIMTADGSHRTRRLIKIIWTAWVTATAARAITRNTDEEPREIVNDTHSLLPAINIHANTDTGDGNLVMLIDSGETVNLLVNTHIRWEKKTLLRKCGDKGKALRIWVHLGHIPSKRVFQHSNCINSYFNHRIFPFSLKILIQTFENKTFKVYIMIIMNKSTQLLHCQSHLPHSCCRNYSLILIHIFYWKLCSAFCYFF